MSDKKKAPAPPPKLPEPPAKQTPPPAADRAPQPDAATGDTAGDAPSAGAATAPGRDLSTIPLLPRLTPGDPSAAPPGTPAAPGTLPRLPPLDWAAMRKPFLNRGVPWTAREAGEVEYNWNFSVNRLVDWGLTRKMAIDLANLGTPLAYDFALKRDYPTTLDRFESETERSLGPGKKLGTMIIPASDILSFGVEKAVGYKIPTTF